MGEQGHEMSRRVLLRGAALTGVTVPVLAACGTDSGDGGSADSGNGNGNGNGNGTTVAASDVPVGGGTILADQEVVVTQPAEGEYRAFSAVCTHQGCIVQTVTEGTINCPCHGSQFSVEDGSVVTGPAPSPLEGLSVSVDGDTVTVS